MVTYEALIADFKGIAAQPNDEHYSITRYNAMASEKKASYVLFPKDAEDVSLAIRFTVAQRLDLAVAGGKHGSFGQSSSDGGVVIDLSKFMNGARVDAENKIAHVQGGCKTATLERETIKYGLGAVVGLCSQVGVTGHLLGGGYGLSLAKYGLALDNLLSATVVIANGTIVTASEYENADLFWALRGGGSNFGVVVEMQVRLHDQRPDGYVCEFFWTPDQLPAVVNEANKWRETQADDELGLLVFAKGPSGPVVILVCYKNGDQASGEASFKQFANLSPIFQAPRQIPWEQVCTVSDQYVVEQCPRLTQGAFVDHLDLETLQGVYTTWLNIITTSPASNSFLMYELYRTEKVAQVPVNATAYACRIPYIPVLIGGIYPDSTGYTEDHAKQVVLRLKNAIETSSEDKEKSQAIKQALSCGYPNYADHFAVESAKKDHARVLFGPNYPRLQQIKKEYDPNMLFNKWFLVQPEDAAGEAT